MLKEEQRIRTSGARAVEPFVVDGLELLAIPQLALDVPGTEPLMNGGDSDTELLLLRRDVEGYTAFGTLPAPGGEDAECFTIDDRTFLAVASIRRGKGPYEYEIESQVWTWADGRFEPFQAIPTFAAKQFTHWSVDGRHFLGLAQGVGLPHLVERNRPSLVLEWDGERFVRFQEIPSRWAYNWHPFTVGDQHFVAHADHLDPSVLYRWDGERLEPHQELIANGGRAFATFERDGEHYLVAAGLEAPARVLRWDGARFAPIQELPGLGARELAVIEHDARLLLVRVNFILGTPKDPQPLLRSQLYEWRDGGFAEVEDFPTCGGTDVAVLRRGAAVEVVVSNSLSPAIRFANDTVVYSLAMNGDA